MPRSGTTVLSKMLDSHPDVVCLSEVFHPEATGIESFSSYCVAHSEIQETIRLSSRASLFRRYLKSIASLYEVPIVGFNAKYASCHQLEADWINYLKRPALFDLVDAWNGKIIHVIRRNVFLQALSIIRARNSGVWHLEIGSEYLHRIYVEVSELIKITQDIQDLVCKFSNYLDGAPNVCTIYYEDMFETSRLSPNLASNLASFLGASSAFDLNPKLSKTSSNDWRTDVINWQAVERTTSSLGIFAGG